MSRTEAPVSPIGSVHGETSRRSRNPAYQAAMHKLAPFERIARMVIARRMAAGWTQQQLAERMGTSHSVISRIESGQHATTVQTLARLADAFETHLVVGFDDAPEEVTIESDGRQLAAMT
jgi:ribosome-binding protein aMBF1 (putative translation factor)